ncbi:MAG TPA: hypothetical protein VIL64_02765 [Solirubrobacteraceae bacterium]
MELLSACPILPASPRWLPGFDQTNMGALLVPEALALVMISLFDRPLEQLERLSALRERLPAINARSYADA